MKTGHKYTTIYNIHKYMDSFAHRRTKKSSLIAKSESEPGAEASREVRGFLEGLFHPPRKDGWISRTILERTPRRGDYNGGAAGGKTMGISRASALKHIQESAGFLCGLRLECKISLFFAGG